MAAVWRLQQLERAKRLGADLHLPLGQDRKKDRRQPRGGRFERIAAIFASGGIIGLSFYTALTPLPLKSVSVSADEPALAAKDTTMAGAATAPARDTISGQAGGNLATARPNSGANVVRQTLPDGTTVTKFSPGSRASDGPVLIDTPRIGQDPRMAAVPNDDLIEQSPYGPIPVIGPDGLRPVEQYARPWSGARGTRIAIVVGGLGLSQTGSQKAIRELPEEVTLAFAAAGNSLQRWMQEARRQGHEILLQVPFEPFDYPANDPGRGTLLTTASADENLDNLHQSLASITNYTGIMNYMGGKFLSDQKALEPVMRDIADRGLLFLDDGSSASSLTGQFASAFTAPHAFANLQIDDRLDETAILTRLDELERIARRDGSAIGVGSAFDETVSAVVKWSDEARRRGIEIVGVSALAADTQR